MQDVKTEIQRNATNQSEMQPNALFQSSVGVAPGINHQSCRELSQRIIILLFHPSKTYRHRCRVISLKPWHHLYFCHTHDRPCVHNISIKLGFARTLWHLFHFVLSWWPHPVLTVSFWLIAAHAVRQLLPCLCYPCCPCPWCPCYPSCPCCSSSIALPMLPMLPILSTRLHISHMCVCVCILHNGQVRQCCCCI